VPIYEYKCEKCGYAFEVFSGFSHNGTRRCPRCKGRAKRVISAPSVIFKGSGFYVTDHKESRASAGSSASGKDITPRKDREKDTKEPSSAPSEDTGKQD